MKKVKAKIKSVLENPNYLDTKKYGIELLDETETFVQLPFNEKMYISSHARLFSLHRHKILKPQLYGNSLKSLRPSYKIKNENGKYKNYFAHTLCAMAFVKNKNPNVATDVHHKNKDIFDNKYNNLIYMERDEHRLLDSGVKLFLYDMEKGTFKQFKSYRRLCNYTGADYRRVYYGIYGKDPEFTFYNGLDGYEIESEEYRGMQMYVGVERIS